MRSSAARARSWVLPVALLVGCNGPVKPEAQVLSRAEAEDVVRQNNTAINLRFKTSGRWSARWTENGHEESYDGKLFLDAWAPDSVRVKGRALGTDAFEVGCNAEYAWIWQMYPADREALYVGAPDKVSAARSTIPLRPSMLVDALGLARFDHPEHATQSVYRVTPEAHQLIFVASDTAGHALIEREVWLDRFPPFLITRVVHRNADGRVVADIHISGHKPIEPGGPLLARTIVARFPLDDAEFKLKLTGTIRQYDEPGVALLDPIRRKQKFPVTLPSDERIFILD